MVSDAGASRPRSPRPMMREASNRRARRTHAQRSRLPHPIFARVVLTENLAGLLGKSLVTGRRRLGDALAASANPFSSSVLSVRASPRIKAVRDSLSLKRRSRPECRMSLHLSALRIAEFVEDIEFERDVACLLAARPKGRLAHSRSYTTFRNLCSERRLPGRGLSLKVCGQLVHDTSPT